MESSINNREFKKHLQEIAHGGRTTEEASTQERPTNEEAASEGRAV